MRYLHRINLFMTAWATLDDPRSIGSARKGSRLGNPWKYRVGDYRIIASIEDGALKTLVVKIGNRRESLPIICHFKP